jgi:hypothetical protein
VAGSRETEVHLHDPRTYLHLYPLLAEENQVTLIRQVPVADLFVECSLRVRNFDSVGLCMSDCCGKPANSAVRTSDNHYLYRCVQHQGIVQMQRGPIVAKVPVKVDCPEELDA